MYTTTQCTTQPQFITTAIDSLGFTLNDVTKISAANTQQPNTQSQQWVLLITPNKMPLKSLLRDRVESLSRIFAISEDQITDMPAFLRKVAQSNNFSSVIQLQDTLTVATENQTQQSLSNTMYFDSRRTPSIPKRVLF